MNNTRTLAIVAVLTAATLVVGVTFAATTHSAFAYFPKKDDKRDKKDGNGNDNGNTITIQKCKQLASESGFDNNQGQECENLICTHPGDNATCVSEGAVATTTTSTTTPPVKLTCEQCFTKFLTPGQITVVVSSEGTLAELCAALEDGRISEAQFLTVLRSPAADVSETIQAQLIECLINAGLPFEPIITRG
jgi:hypothetical protein